MRVLIAVLSIVLFVGCSSTNTMIEQSVNQALPLPSEERAQIVFLRPSSYFQAMATLLYEAAPSGDRLIAPITGHNKVVYEAEPGTRVFFSNNGVMAHFMTAHVEAGKRYYVLVRPIHGYGFQLRPIRSDGKTDYDTSHPEFPSWLSETAIVEASSTAAATIASVQAGYNNSRAKGHAEWMEKSEEQRAELTVNHSDGVDP